MTSNVFKSIGWLGVALVLLPGCLVRKEKIKVARDGAVAWHVEYTGKTADFNTADALPSQSGGWDEFAIEAEKEGTKDEKKELKAQRTFAPTEPLPRNFAAVDDPDADLYLDFPTDVTMEQVAGDTMYRFRRSYTPRAWQYTEYWQDRFFDEDVKKLLDKPTEELTDRERRTIIEALTAVEVYRMVELAKDALQECAPDLDTVPRLQARQAALDVLESHEDFASHVIARCADLPDEPRAECFEREIDALLGAARQAFRASLERDAGFNLMALQIFDRALERAEKRYRVTNQLGGHAFEIQAELPGTIVAHNGNKILEDKDSVTVTWEFSGEAFRDRKQEVIAVSRASTDGR